MFKPFGFVMREIHLHNKKLNLTDDIEAVAEGDVKPIGNGAMIMSAKKYIGRKVYVLVRKL